jgi:hypothetical protein
VVEVFGGSPTYTDDLGGYKSMLAHHRGAGITPEQRLRFATLMSLAADDVDPHRQPLHVGRLVMRRPPHLVVGGGFDLAHDPAQDRPPGRRVQVGGEPPSGFDGGEVLDLVARAAAQVLCQNRSTSFGKCSASRAVRR